MSPTEGLVGECAVHPSVWMNDRVMVREKGHLVLFFSSGLLPLLLPLALLFFYRYCVLSFPLTLLHLLFLDVAMSAPLLVSPASAPTHARTLSWRQWMRPLGAAAAVGMESK